MTSKTLKERLYNGILKDALKKLDLIIENFNLFPNEKEILLKARKMLEMKKLSN